MSVPRLFPIARTPDHTELTNVRISATQWCHEVIPACGAGNAIILKVRWRRSVFFSKLYSVRS